MSTPISQRQARRMLNAIRWAMGTNGDFRQPRESEGRYYWRHELRERAGIKYDGKQYQLPKRKGKR